MDTLTPRQQTILNCVIMVHIETAQPVSSRFVTEHARLNFSPATVRHEMGLLEERGYLTHPHTSSGRIPTDQGYRYYVDHDFKEVLLPSYFFDQVKDDLMDASGEFSSFAEKVSGMLSSFSEQTGLVVCPDPPAEDFEKASRRKLFLQGSAHMLEKPEFQDMEKLRSLFKTFEEKSKLMDWLAGKPGKVDVSISIGRENQPESLWDCAVVSTRFTASGKNLGTLAIVGPKRMRYAHTVPLVRQMAVFIGQILEQKEGDFVL